MKNFALLAVLMVFGLSLFSGCASMQTLPDYKGSAEKKMVVIQEKIGGGLKTGALTPDQSQSFLAKLKAARKDYEELRDKRFDRNEWDSFFGRLDALGEDINGALARTSSIEEPGIWDRIATLQRTIDDRTVKGRLPLTEVIDFSDRLDAIRNDYVQMTEGGRSVTNGEKKDISKRLNLLEMDMNQFQ